MSPSRKNSSLDNTVDVDILQFILTKLRTRMTPKSRKFLIKIKTLRGEPLNERADDPAKVGRSPDKTGEDYHWKDRTVYSYYDMTSSQWMKDIP